VLVLWAVLLGLSACGDDGERPRRTIAIEARDLSKEKPRLGAPARARAGLVDLQLRNDGDMLHDAQLFRIEGRHSLTKLVIDWLEDLDSAEKPAWAHPEGGVAPVRPGDTATVTQVLRPGSYLIVDTQERKGLWPTTNAAKGGATRLVVSGRPRGRLPETSASITATDSGFEVDGVGSGPQELTFANTGKELHHVVALPVPEGPSWAKAKRDLIDGQSGIEALGWVPVDGIDRARGTTVLESGGSQVTELDLDPGRYALVCVVSDRKGGASHLVRGMATELNVD
jgi:hypothetical protein